MPHNQQTTSSTHLYHTDTTYNPANPPALPVPNGHNGLPLLNGTSIVSHSQQLPDPTGSDPHLYGLRSPLPSLPQLAVPFQDPAGRVYHVLINPPAEAVPAPTSRPPTPRPPPAQLPVPPQPTPQLPNLQLPVPEPPTSPPLDVPPARGSARGRPRGKGRSRGRGRGRGGAAAAASTTGSDAQEDERGERPVQRRRVGEQGQPSATGEDFSHVFGVGPTEAATSLPTLPLGESSYRVREPLADTVPRRPHGTRRDASDIWWHARPLKTDEVPTGEWPDATAEERSRSKPSSKDYPYIGCKLCM
jgi:hypothetical protein